jgi:hypothetical protein
MAKQPGYAGKISAWFNNNGGFAVSIHKSIMFGTFKTGRAVLIRIEGKTKQYEKVKAVEDVLFKNLKGCKKIIVKSFDDFIEQIGGV